MKRFFCVLILLTLVFRLPVGALGTSAKAAAVINGDTGEVIYADNADERLPMASTTKIMTALLLCEHGALETELTVTADMLRVEGSSMGLLAGDRVSYHDLLYGMLLASGNDAANVTAIALAGSVEKFAAQMNAKAAELGLKNTHFVTPSGLDADGHCTTARELALLAAYALKNEDFAAAAGSKSATLCYGNPPYKRTLTNHNKLLKLFDGAVGVKTGFTKKAGRCLVSAARRDGKLAVAVTLNDPNDWDDHAALLKYGLDSIVQTRFTPATAQYRIPVIGANEELVVFIEPITVNTVKTDEISCTVKLPKFVYAPIKRGEPLGSVEYKMGGESVGEAALTALRDIPAERARQKPWTVLLKNIRYILKSV